MSSKHFQLNVHKESDIDSKQISKENRILLLFPCGKLSGDWEVVKSDLGMLDIIIMVKGEANTLLELIHPIYGKVELNVDE